MQISYLSSSSKQAFSLVELSIVLVILGLLTGGILAGQSLIRAAELRSIVSDYQRFTTARQTFRDKYLAIPGDMNNATRFWSRLNSNADCATNSSAAVATPGTCDGNGDGIIREPAAASQSGEAFQFWRQLTLAGLIEGSYSGLAGSTGSADHNFGTNSPPSKISAAGWGASYTDNSSNAFTTVFRRNYFNAFTIGGDSGVWADGTFLRTEEAWNIDTKLDDGKSGLGRVQAYPVGNSCNLAANNADYSAEYALSNTAQNACTLVFPQEQL